MRALKLVLLSVLCFATGFAQGELLYNGIRLPEQWPPRLPFTYAPMEVPYLKSPPEVIPIDMGRQLFVDDFLIESTNLARTYHTARFHPASPVLKPDREWEREGESPTAMPFSGGVFYDPRERLFKMWYMCGYVRGLCYATSTDGLRWRKPQLDVRPGTNIVSPIEHDTSAVWLDLEEKDPRKRFKMWLTQTFGSQVLAHYVSADGLRWRDADARSAARVGDRTTVFWNPFRRVWVYSIRTDAPMLGRYRSYREHPDAAAGSRFTSGQPVPWIGADRLDTKRPDLNVNPELYNLDAVAYESLMVGLFSIWRGQPKDRAKPNEVLLGFSRDGFHWFRPDRRPFIPVSERYGDWNWANVQSAAGGFLIVRDQLYFYVSGRSGIPGTTDSGHSTTGLAVLRRDGFASMDAGTAEGTLTTRLLKFGGRRLFVNLAAAGGELSAEVLDSGGRPVSPFTRANCAAIRSDNTALEVKWAGANDLSALAGKPVRFRFYLRNGQLDSFWVSPDASGASHGYVAAGGPGYPGPVDTVGVPSGLPAASEH